MQRQFTSGSRQAPDPFDQFLEQHNFYRKHTARDASCLFRVISEQMYDTQKHHLTIRKKCVAYMRKHRSFFQPLVDRDLDEYLDDMSKPRTYGTMIELQAVGYMYQRNVVLFEAFNLGNYFITRPCYEDTFRIFYTPERHFDSVFTCDYIKDAAICQSIVYEILYKNIYKLPDVPFAVEQMLHSPTFDTLTYRTEYNDDGYCRRLYLSDGRVFYFDLPNDTKCILENYKLCYFHCLTEDIQEDTKNEGKIFSKAPESLLPHKYVSCVRQLLIEGITPFPYKVAKALDPNMYRNIEFDAWNEARKELKIINWYNGDTNFKVGAKCNVKIDNLDRSRLFTCHIQDISVNRANCLVFVEELGEKRLVPYESLIPLPADEFKPWSLPYKFQRHFQKYNPYRYKHIGCKIRLGNHFCGSDYCTNFAEFTEDNYQDPFKFNQYTKLDHFRSHVEYCTMPFTVEQGNNFKEKVQPPVNGDSLEDPNSSNGCGTNSTTLESGEMCKTEVQDYNTSNSVPQANTEGDSAYSTQFSSSYQGQNSTGMPEEFYGYSTYDQPTTSASTPFVYMINYPNYANQVYMPSPAGYSTTQPFISAPIPQNGSIYYGNNYYQNPNYYPPSGIAPVNTVYNNSPPTSRFGPGNGRINYDARPSVNINGSDLPNDVATVRYFFNLGIEYHMKNSSKESDGDTDDELIPSASNLKIECKSDQSKEETKYDSNNNSVARVNSNVENIRRAKHSNQSQFHQSSGRYPNRRFTSRPPMHNKERFGSRPNYGRYDGGGVNFQKYNTPSSSRYRNRNSPADIAAGGSDHHNGFGGDESRSDNQTPCSNIANNLVIECQSESAKASVVPSPQYSVPQAPPGALLIPVPPNPYNSAPPPSQSVPMNMQQPYAAGGQYNSCIGAPPPSTPLAGNIQMMPSSMLPGIVNNGYYTATAPIHEGDNDNGMQYQFMPQAPNMQIYIPAVNNAQNLSPLIPTQPVAAGPSLPPVAGSQSRGVDE